MSIQEKPSLDEALVHFGVKGMKWGVRKERTPAQEIQRLTKKINRIDADSFIEGESLRGWALRKQYKKAVRKDPKFKVNKLSLDDQIKYHRKATRRVKRSVALRGAAEVATILGGTYGLTKVTKTSAQGRAGVLISSALLAGQVGSMRVEQIHQISLADKMNKLQRQRSQLGYKPS